MVTSVINEYRTQNDKKPVSCWVPIENDFCYAHCVYLAHNCLCEHTPQCYLKNRAEAIAQCTNIGYITDTIRYLIFDIFDGSPEHKNIILNYDNLAYGLYIYNGNAYLTIRAW